MAVILILFMIFVIIATGCSKTDTTITDKIAKLDGQVIHVYENEDEALENPIESDNINRTLEINGKYKVSAGFHNGVKIPSPFIMEVNDDNTYTLEIEKLYVKTTLIITIYEETNNSKTYELLTGNKKGKHYYIAISVNPTNSAPEDETPVSTKTKTIQKSLIPPPSGKIFINDLLYVDYEDETKAKNAAKVQQLYISGTELSLKANPNEGTVRIYIKPYSVDDELLWKSSKLLHQDNEWTDTLDISEYSGHLLTLKVQAESNKTTNNGYTYISFYVPAIG